jgi:hypothetical protein
VPSGPHLALSDLREVALELFFRDASLGGGSNVAVPLRADHGDHLVQRSLDILFDAARDRPVLLMLIEYLAELGVGIVKY